MPVAIAFIRGINVGGNRKLPMAVLRVLCEGLGWEDVATYIQSGNLVFRCGAREVGRAAAGLAGAIEKKAGFRPGVVVRTVEEMRGVRDANPFAERRGIDPAKLLVLFLEAAPAAGAAAALAAIRPDPEEIVLLGREVYLYYPDGVGKSKLPFTKVEKAAGVPGTTRNWNTVLRMIELGGAVEGA